MNSKLSKIALSFIVAVSIFSGVGINSNTKAQTLGSAEVTQQGSQTIVRGYFFTSFPPSTIYYNDGVYRGYLSRVSYEPVPGGYNAIYAGTVSDGNVPLPTKIISQED